MVFRPVFCPASLTLETTLYTTWLQTVREGQSPSPHGCDVWAVCPQGSWAACWLSLEHQVSSFSLFMEWCRPRLVHWQVQYHHWHSVPETIPEQVKMTLPPETHYFHISNLFFRLVFTTVPERTVTKWVIALWVLLKGPIKISECNEIMF